ncbi:TlpA disulfide reductase family protein [Pedobacter sp. ASV28]|uniref:TlpA family protein disulfide reductase n=1 Tax=Pedobacter sp. ASV28 TaxID=2795123 RepID=UPI0018EB7A1D|nr:TlpA disulfide reductase family protein [Pedobacter sp. ASV28]
MKRNIITFLLFYFAMNNLLAQTSAKRVVITGKMINSTASTPKVLGVNFLNPFNNTRKSAEIDSQMQFSVQENMLFTQNMTLAYNSTFINLYVVPGDSIHLVIDAALLNTPNFKWLTISGDHAKISTQLNLLHYYLSQLPYQKYNYALSAPDMLTDAKKDYLRYLTAINDYTKQYDIDPIVVDFAKRDVKYGISNWISGYVNEGTDSVVSRSERINIFKDPFFEFGIDTNFVSMMYPYHLQNYVYWKTGTDSSITKAIKAGHFKQALTLGAEIFLKEPSSISRDYLMFTFFSYQLKKTPTLQNELSLMKKYFTDPALYQYLELLSGRIGNVVVKPTALAKMQYLDKENKVSTIKDPDFLKFLSKKYAGKVIYLDIYATWCVPCLNEIKFTPALHQKFRDKNVVFVNLCLQSTAKNWINLVKEKNIKGENYFLDDDESKLLMGNFNIGGFPTYLLIDSKGSIKTANAARPSELEKLEKEIEKL